MPFSAAVTAEPVLTSTAISSARLTHPALASRMNPGTPPPVRDLFTCR